MPSILVHERLMAVPYLIGTIPVPNEGSILPDSYSYRRGESRSTVLKRMQEAMTRELNALWAKRQPHSVVDTREEALRSEEHTSELQSLMRISYAVFCLKKKQRKRTHKYNSKDQ